jgi:hypothetical protein
MIILSNRYMANMNKTAFIYLVVLLTAMNMAISCASTPKYHPGGPYYYKSWADYFLPYRPVNEISLSEAKELGGQGYAYYIAFFNDIGMIVSFEKQYRGKMEFKATYYYDKGVLRKEEVIDLSGKIIKSTMYDEKGRRINPDRSSGQSQ